MAREPALVPQDRGARGGHRLPLPRGSHGQGAVPRVHALLHLPARSPRVRLRGASILRPRDAQGREGLRGGGGAQPARPQRPAPGGGADPMRATAAHSAREPLLVVGRAALLTWALVAVGIFHVWSHTRVTSAGYRLGELQRAQAALRAERNRLEVEVATLRAPGRLEAFARTRLGMAPPAPGAVVAGRAGE